MEEQERNWKQEMERKLETALGLVLVLACGAAMFLPIWFWGWPGLLAPAAIFLLFGVVAWLCVDKNNRLIALLLLFLGLS
jgi:CHASE2 domain-containing sensor protein